MSVRVRFAPSPTGKLHIGGLRTALYNWLFARQQGGTFVLRIEDTDRSRYDADSEEDIIDSLQWAGLQYDEGPRVDGPHGPYYQSQRSALYRTHVDQLLDAGHAYVAFDPPEALDALRADNQSYNAATRGRMDNALTLGADEVARRIESGEPYVVRLKVQPGGRVQFTDLIRGVVAFDTSEIDDQVLLKSDGMPTYHLANVVDDHHMQITHVIRGEEWLPSVPKHLLLYRAFGWTPPQRAHLPLILAPSGGKLSKRNAETLGIPVSVEQYRAAGYDADALVNFLALLGWNPGTEQERFTRGGLAEAFDFDGVSKSGAKFDLDKLRWFNGQAVRDMAVEDLADEACPALARAGIDYDDATLDEAARLMQDRVTFPHEIAEARYFFEDPTDYDEKGVKKRWKADAADLVAAYADRLETLDTFDAETAERELRSITEAREIGAGRLIHPTRLAISGVTFGPGLFDLMVAIGREGCVRRMKRAVEVLG
ncbi:MAG: glutamate--tRNA ligase [Bacteroidota bacterium]